ncbi:MAG: hypothetical protein HY585_00990 [Candidatus Omnitrophica bacterium]|nr:hypothetical protein [Candidatus Omnitrophota bacterium]
MKEKNEEGTKRCPRCGMSIGDWTYSFTKGGVTYCCEGCANNTGCICEDLEEENEDIAM